MEQHITDDLSSLLAILPPEIAEALTEINRYNDLLEVILDLGRVPTARFTDGEYNLLNREVTQDDLDLVVLQVGDFDADNRAGIERTLHRISGIRNRRGEVVGLTCRVGRAVFGTIDIIRDIIESGNSILILGKPGVGKTTMLREAARVLAETKRVVIVDTSNEIGGDGDIPHPAVGKARRMQVPTPNLQHEVMIEAVENHNPEVIVIDEIGRELEAQAARTIAERGVQLIGTAHGINLDNLLLNPTLSDLVGGIESVTLSDEEARRRGTQKTVLERRAPPTFDVLIELQDRHSLFVHGDVTLAVDTLLRGRPSLPEVRSRTAGGEIVVQPPPEPQQPSQQGNGRKSKSKKGDGSAKQAKGGSQAWAPSVEMETPRAAAKPVEPANSKRMQSVYPYGIARNRLIEAARRFKLPLRVVDSLDEADVLLTLKNFYRRRPRLVADAEHQGVSIYVLRSNTVTQIEDFLVELFEVQSDVTEDSDDLLQRAMREAREGIQAIMNGMPSIDLSPQKASIRRQQHELARQANLQSHSYGRDPDRHIRIYRG
ncbi:MAG: AAA family ATPase [Anaerolineae bacterium]|nr:AAA family ATPase [Anaerolineae bacterium]